MPLEMLAECFIYEQAFPELGMQESYEFLENGSCQYNPFLTSPVLFIDYRDEKNSKQDDGSMIFFLSLTSLSFWRF